MASITNQTQIPFENFPFVIDLLIAQHLGYKNSTNLYQLTQNALNEMIYDVENALTLTQGKVKLLTDRELVTQVVNGQLNQIAGEEINLIELALKLSSEAFKQDPICFDVAPLKRALQVAKHPPKTANEIIHDFFRPNALNQHVGRAKADEIFAEFFQNANESESDQKKKAAN